MSMNIHSLPDTLTVVRIFLKRQFNILCRDFLKPRKLSLKLVSSWVSPPLIYGCLRDLVGSKFCRKKLSYFQLEVFRRSFSAFAKSTLKILWFHTGTSCSLAKSFYVFTEFCKGL